MELTLDQALKKGSEAHKAGQVEEAERYYSVILKAHPAHPIANHNMGLLAFSVGKALEALPFFKVAVEANPNVSQFWLSYINILIKLDRLDDAKTVLNQARDRGVQGAGFERLVQRIDELATDTTSSGQDPSEDKLQSLVNLYNNGELQTVLTQAKRLLEESPNSAFVYNIIGGANQRVGKLKEAVEAYKKAISIKPDFAEAYNNMGVAFKHKGNLDEAIRAFEKVLSINPMYVSAWSNGAEALETWNKLVELEFWLERAFRTFDTVPVDLKFMKCKMLWRNNRSDEAFTLISNINFEEVPGPRKQDFQFLKAKLFEKAKNFDKAYSCFLFSNSLAKKSENYYKSEPEKYFKNLKKKLSQLSLSPQLTTSHVQDKSKTESDFNPIFLVGFPRSGTTLLDTVLRSHSEICVVEEKPLLRVAENFLTENGYDDPIGMDIPKNLRVKARNLYQREFKKYISASEKCSTFIDKHPLHLLHVPLIHQLYPKAKFILALRHPLDAILSCWMQNFTLNKTTANFVDLDRIVDFYCIAMETFKICRKKYDIKVHEIRYEDLINDFQKKAEESLRFISLKWEPGIENFQDTALERGRIDTPSYSQVVQPLYTDAQYRWLNYSKYLEQYFGQVEPWLSEFGYN